MKLKYFFATLVVLGLASDVVFAQQNPYEKTLNSQIMTLKTQLVQLDSTLERGGVKGRFSVEISDSLNGVNDYLMGLNERLYWLSPKDSIENTSRNAEEPMEVAAGEDEPAEPMAMDSLPKPPSDFNWTDMMPKPKVKSRSLFLQGHYGATMLLGNIASGATEPTWNINPLSNKGITLLYAFRIGKADMSKIKFEMNLKKKFTTSNFIKASPFQFRIGVGLHSQILSQDSDYSLSLDAQKQPSFVKKSNALDKNNLRIYYVQVPMTLWFRIAGKTYGEVGGFADITRKTVETQTYKEDGREINVNRKGDFGVNRLGYGLKGVVGYDKFAVYCNYQLSSLFKKNDIYDYNLMTVGVRFGY